MAAAHSTLGASSASRWLSCPGSVRLVAKVPNPTSEYMAEGTAAHSVAEMAYREGRRAEHYIGQSIKVSCQATGRVFNIQVTGEMADAVNVYLDAIAAVCRTSGEDNVLTVLDYKHGSGRPVHVKGNRQLKYYALGAMLAIMKATKKEVAQVEVRFNLESMYPGMFGTADFVHFTGEPGTLPRKVRFGIVQPRCEHPDGPFRLDEIDAIDLMDFADELVKGAKAADAPDAPLIPGSHCKDTFCPARATCPALKKTADEVAASIFSKVNPETVGAGHTPEQMAENLRKAELVEAWAHAYREFCYTEAERGNKPAGYKMVEKRAVRKWADPLQVRAFLLLRNFKHDAIYHPAELKSPPQIEALIKSETQGKEHKERRELLMSELATLYKSESSGHALVPESDKRPEVTRQTAEDVFKPVETV